LPPTKKELKKQNPILAAHEERKKTIDLALDPGWSERGAASRAKTRVRSFWFTFAPRFSSF
jgi:hypothetical protein